MRKKVGILGGTFDPPHYGHLIIANEVLEQLQLDEIQFMPNQEPPHKNRKSGTSNEDRLAMLELCTSGHSRFAIEKIEMERPGKSFTFDTMKLLTEKHPETDYFFIIGADMIEYLPKWHRIDELVEMIQFVGVNRPHHQTGTEYRLQHVAVPQIEISSTLIREKIAEGKSAKYLLPENALAYIKEHQLYES